MITEDELRTRMHYDDAHLPQLSGADLAESSRRRTARRRWAAGGTVAAAAVLVAGASTYSAWQRQPHIVQADLAYASGPTLTLPDGSIETFGGLARAWVDSRGDLCWGNDVTSLCRKPTDETAAGSGSPFASIYGEDTPDAILGGLVHQQLTHASFTTEEGRQIAALAIQFRLYPGWTVVVAALPRDEDGRIPAPGSLTFNGN